MAKRDELQTVYLRNVPAGIVREAKARAARRGMTLTAFVTQALAASLQSEEEREGPAEEDLRASMEWYERQKRSLEQRYPGEYVAITDRAVIDHDRDFDSLAARVFDRVGVRPLFMPRLGEARARVRSPRRRVS